MFIDSHCHLNFEQLKNKIDDVIANAKKANIDAMLNIATRKEEFDENLDLIKPYDFIYQAVGTHPHNAQDDSETSPQPLVDYIQRHQKIIAVGETGLDFYYDYSPREQQEQQFRRHITAARILDLPVIVHTRNAESDTLRILKDELNNGHFNMVIHCFSGTYAFAQSCLELGAFLSFSGILTFKSAIEIKKVAKDAPSERILIETDAPYLAPIPYRGKTNEPSYMVSTAECLALERNVSIQEIASNTSNNFYNLFTKARS